MGIASYVCSSLVQPIPLLVKTKVKLDGPRCQVGVKIRSNPANSSPLSEIAMIMAIPPDIKGETVKLMKRDGDWDGMKRIISWRLPTLQPGELIELQVQFQFVNPDQGLKMNPTFPILVRCNAANEQFSDILLDSVASYDSRVPMKMTFAKAVRILHRKV